MGFRLLLERQSWVERCVVAAEGREAMEQARRLKPDVALIDLLLRDESGAELCEELHATLPETRILLLSGVGSISPAVARRAGASGFVSKDLGAGDIVKAVRMVALGMEVFGRGEEQAGPLSGREREVVGLIAAGGDEPRDRPAPLPLRTRSRSTRARSTASSESGTGPRP